MSKPNPSRLQLALGLVAGLAVGIGLVAWLGSAGRRAARQEAGDQASVVTLASMVELVAEARAAGVDVQELVVRAAELDPAVAAVRVVDLKGRRLVASTVDADQADGLPVRLARKNPDHKTWYDTGQELRAAIDANRDEGRLWKEEIQVEPLPDGGSSLAAPLEEEGKVSGVVLLTTRPRPHQPASALRGILTYLASSLVLFFAASALLKGGRQRAVAALAIGVLSLIGYSVKTLGDLDAARLGAEEDIAGYMTATAGFIRSESPGAEVDPASWDVDRFRQPRGVIAGDGTIDAATVRASFAQVRGRFAWLFGVAGLLGFGVCGWVGLGYALATWRTLKRYREAYAFVTPAMVGMLLLVFFPFFYGVLLSFTNQSIYNLNEPLYSIWVGFDNYVSVLTDFEIVRTVEGTRAINYQNFYWTLGFTAVWTVTNVTFGVSMGLLLALILNTKGLKGRGIYRVLLILPWAVPNYITALIWKGMFHQQFGVINQFVQMFGGSPVAWFDTPFTSFLTVLTTNGWLSFPFMMVVALGALQSIPSDLYEAAKVDGANRWQQFTHITLPSLKPAMVPAVILSVIWTFNQFNVIYLVSEGEPGGGTEILITEAYKVAFEQYRYGYAAAYASVIFLILLVYGNWQNRVTRATEGV